MSLKDYKELEVWKKSRQLVQNIYMLAKDFPNDEKIGLSSQIKRSSISISSNIAKGIGKQTKKETKQFFYIAKESLYELETQLFDLSFINEKILNVTISQLIEVRKLIIGFIKYLEK